MTYVTSHTRRARATRDEMQDRARRLIDVMRENQPGSVRSFYYRAVVAGIVPKTESGYNKVQRMIAQLRIDGVIPFSWVTDSTRWMRKPKSWNSVDDLLHHTASTYRRNLWATAETSVEVWAESDSIAGVLYPVTAAWDVPLMVTRGFSSISFAHNAAQSMNNDGRPVEILYIGDHDPSGLEIESKMIDYLNQWCHVSITWRRVGVCWDQVDELGLPGTPPKKPYGFPMAVEAEALPPPLLRDMLDDEIGSHVDQRALDLHRAAEESERDILTAMAARWAS